MKELQSHRIAVVTNVLPHYRVGVIRELTRDGDVVFLADPRDRFHSIPCLHMDGDASFIKAPFYQVGRIFLQPRAVWFAMFSRVDAIVYLAQAGFITTWLAALISKARRKRVVFWGIGFFDDERSFMSRLRARFYSLADDFCLYSYRSKLIAQSFGLDQDRLHVVFNSLEYESRILLRERCLFQRSPAMEVDDVRDGLSILCISRLTPRWQYDLLLRALAIVRDREGPAARLVFVGDGPELQPLRDLATSLSLEVEFKGAVYDEEALAPLLFDADVTVMPGKVGLSAMHSLMYGTPVITHSDYDLQAPEVEAIVEGYTGMFFNRGDPEDLARALLAFRNVFPDLNETRRNCFAMIDKIYNPRRQREVLLAAINGSSAEAGDDAQHLFPLDAPADARG